MKYMHLVGLLVVLILTTVMGFSQTHITGGYVSGVWDLAGSPYYIEGNCVIHQDSSLMIEPGVQVIFNPLCRFRVEGQLLAIGTEADSITFTALDTTIDSESTDFLNTDLSPRDSSKLVYCRILYGVGSPWPDPYMHGGGLYLKNSSRVLISHCLIAHCRTRSVTGANGYNGQSGTTQGQPGGPGEGVESGKGGAIYCENASPAIEFSVICFNHTGNANGGDGGNGGGALNMGGGSAAGGSGGIAGNGTGGKGGAIYLLNSSALIHDNKIYSNCTGDGHGGQGGYGGGACSPDYYAWGGMGGDGGPGNSGKGAAIYTEQSHATINNNLIYENRLGTGFGGNGGMGGSASTSYIGAAGNGGDGGNGYGAYGYAIYLESGSYGVVNNCTITDHYPLSIGQAGAGGLPGGLSAEPGDPGQTFAGDYVVYGPNITLKNSIIWNNAVSAISSSAQVSFSCVQGGFPGMGNISSNPLFVNAVLENFCLAQIAAGQPQQSPCVDAGDPYATMIIGTTRTDGIQDSGVVDMGFHYPLNTTLPEIALVLTLHNPPIQIPSGGGSFQFDVEMFYNALFTSVIDFWTIITLPDGTPLPIFTRNNITLPSGGYVLRPNLTQYVPAGAPPGTYTYTAYIRDHNTWEELANDSFTFEKLSGYDYPKHNRGWFLDGWDNANR